MAGRKDRVTSTDLGPAWGQPGSVRSKRIPARNQPLEPLQWLGLLLVLSVGQCQAAADCSRRNPLLPQHVSEAFRASLEKQSDLKKTGAVPQSAEEWNTLRQRLDALQAAEAARVLKHFDVKARNDAIDGVSVVWLTPQRVRRHHEAHLFIFLQGGGFITGVDDAGWAEGVLIAAHVGIPVLVVDYGLPPDRPFPAGIDEVTAVYRALLKNYSSESLVLGGTSVGGGLALGSAHNFRKLGLPMPAALFSGAPLADMTKTGDTCNTNEGIDRVLFAFGDRMKAGISLYANGHDVRNPLISPVYGDFTGFPPVLLVSGTRDLLLSDAVRTHRRMRAAAVAADLHVFEAMSHADYLILWNAPETSELYRELGRFIDHHLPK